LASEDVLNFEVRRECLMKDGVVEILIESDVLRCDGSNVQVMTH